MDTEELLEILLNNCTLEDLYEEGYHIEELDRGLEPFIERNKDQLVELFREKGLLGYE